MEVSRVVQFLLPRLPLLFRTLLLSVLRLSPNCDKQDARTEVIVTLIRSAMDIKEPILVIQQRSLKAPKIMGDMWISKATIPAPDARIRELVIQAVHDLGGKPGSFMLPDIDDVEGEWTGFRRGVGKKEPRPNVPEQEQYESLMKDVSSDVTILYFHGGGYVIMDPATHRKVNSALAKKTGGRTFSVRYRLAPQSAFPSQLLDGFISYLYLLAPPPGSSHEPVPASKIVLAGDSAGGNLAFSLLLLLLTLRRSGITSVSFHGREVSLDLPAGVSGNSPWMDVSRSLLSAQSKYDYLKPSTETGAPPYPIPEDEIWPAKPPRADMFSEASVIDNPLATLIATTPEMWKGAPPVFMCTGEEALENELVITARTMLKAGVSVNVVGYEGQPHCFAMIFPTSVPGKDCMNRWAQFCIDAINKTVKGSDKISWMKAFSSPPEFTERDLATSGTPDAEVRRLLERMKGHVTDRENKARMEYDKQAKAKL